jgi:hypothetical protein
VVRAVVWLVLVGACRINFDDVATSADASAGADAPPGYFTIGGTVSGVTADGLVVQDNGADDLPLHDGAFTFTTAIVDGGSYAVTIKSLPTGEDCTIASGSGTVAGAPVTTVQVACNPTGACPSVPLTFTTSGSFTLPAACTGFTVDATGGGGAGGAKHQGTAGAGGYGGHAAKTFTGLTPNTMFTITIGLGGTCGAKTATAGGYGGGAGGAAGVTVAATPGGNGLGASAPPGGLGGAGSSGTQPGAAGGNGGYGGGGGGGGGDTADGNSAGAATTFQLASPLTDYVVAGGGGAAGAADQPGDVAGPGGSACNGYNGADGTAAIAGTRSAGGGGGGACACMGGCNDVPTSAGGHGGAAGTSGSCAPAQNGEHGRVVLSFP